MLKVNPKGLVVLHAREATWNTDFWTQGPLACCLVVEQPRKTRVPFGVVFLLT